MCSQYGVNLCGPFVWHASLLQGLSVIGGLDYWNGLLEWTTGMDFDLFFFFFLPRANYIQCIQLVKYKNHRFLPFCYFPLQIERK